jgi:hypothetical protein
VHGNPEFDNYAVEWKPLFDDLLDLIRSRKSIAKFSKSALTYSVKWKLKFWTLLKYKHATGGLSGALRAKPVDHRTATDVSSDMMVNWA